MHLVCFRLRLHGRTPAAYDVRARDFAYESASYSFRALADRRLRAALSSLAMLVSRRTCSVPLLLGPRLAGANETNHRERYRLGRFFFSPPSLFSRPSRQSSRLRSRSAYTSVRRKAALSCLFSSENVSDLQLSIRFQTRFFFFCNCFSSELPRRCLRIFFFSLCKLTISSIDCLIEERHVSLFFFFLRCCFRRCWRLFATTSGDICSRVFGERRLQNRLIKPRARPSGGLF